MTKSQFEKFSKGKVEIGWPLVVQKHTTRSGIRNHFSSERIVIYEEELPQLKKISDDLKKPKAPR